MSPRSGPEGRIESPVPADAGVSASRERRWGWIGGAVGAASGVGAFVVAWAIQGEHVSDLAGSPYPPLFEKRELMALDYYFLAVLLAGVGFLLACIYALRRSAYPRSDGFGAALVGMVLTGVAGAALFLRLVAVL